MNKSELIKAVVASLTESLVSLDRAARAAHAEATHESSKAENKYDTRGLEAAYLAGGQARQARELAESVKMFEALPLRDFPKGSGIELSALVELEVNGEKSSYFLGPRNGGLEFTYKGREICLITPQSPLGAAIMGRSAGEKWIVKSGNQSTKYRIVTVV